VIAARILRTPGAPRLLAAAFLGRLPIGMTGLALLLLVRDASGSYALAGACAGAFALAEGVCSPLQGRAVDRAGIARVLVPCAGLYAAALAGVVAAAAAGAPAAVLLVLSAVAGAG
jgi:MFS family permease